MQIIDQEAVYEAAQKAHETLRDTYRARSTKADLVELAKACGATMAILRESTSHPGLCILLVSVPNRGVLEDIDRAVQLARTVGVSIHVVDLIPDKMLLLAPRKPKGLVERVRAWFGKEFQKVDVVELDAVNYQLKDVGFNGAATHDHE